MHWRTKRQRYQMIFAEFVTTQNRTPMNAGILIAMCAKNAKAPASCMAHRIGARALLKNMAHPITRLIVIVVHNDGIVGQGAVAP